MTRPSVPPIADLVLGALCGAAALAWGCWEIAVGLGVPEERLIRSIWSSGWIEYVGGRPLVPIWVRALIGAEIAGVGGVILAGVVQESQRRLGIRVAAAPPSARARSIAALVMGVSTGALGTLVGGILFLTSIGVIETEGSTPGKGGGEPNMPWFLGGVGGFVALMALLLTYSSVYQWMSGRGSGAQPLS